MLEKHVAWRRGAGRPVDESHHGVQVNLAHKKVRVGAQTWAQSQGLGSATGAQSQGLGSAAGAGAECAFAGSVSAVC